MPNTEVYRGLRTSTRTNRLCDFWQNHANYTTSKYPFSSITGRYCRNPGNQRASPWCFTSSNTWEYCNLPMCAIAPTFTSPYPLGSKLSNKHLIINSNLPNLCNTSFYI